MRGSSLAACALVLVAGCLGSGPSEPQVDPAEASVNEPEHRVFVPDARGDANRLDPRADPTWPIQHLDLLGVEFGGVSADGMRIALSVARLDAKPAPSHGSLPLRESNVYSACWKQEKAPWACATWERSITGKGVTAGSSVSMYDKTCNEFSVCLWALPATVTFGEPATIEWKVPWKVLLWNDAPSRVTQVDAGAYWGVHFDGFGQHGAYSASFPGLPHQHDHPIGVPGGWGGAADVIPASPVALELNPPMASPTTPMFHIKIPADEGFLWGHDRHATDAIDLVFLELENTADALRVTFGVKDLPRLPDYTYHLTLDVGVHGSEYWEIGLWRMLNPNHLSEPYAYAGRCVTWHCGQGYAHGSLQPAKLTIETGQPGRFIIEAPFKALGGPALREITLLRAWSMTSDAAVFWGSPGDETHGDVHMMRESDVISGGFPVWMGNDPDAKVHHDHR